ncbi:unnamed protein product [Allacma fusca]|uniref:C2H2-type domain-containing protein n=1 Tax=Allacma fusca TaxID=39272 RepID=A0A8J2NX11_9HEXA|nr:unnamed protein product [Allacma fusca]
MDHSFPWLCKKEENPVQDPQIILTYQCQICQGTVSSSNIHEHAKSHQSGYAGLNETDSMYEPIIKIEEEESDVIFEGQIFGRSLPNKYNAHCTPHSSHHHNFNCSCPFNGRTSGTIRSFTCGYSMGIPHLPIQQQHHFQPKEQQKFVFKNPFYLKVNHSASGHRLDTKNASHNAGGSSETPGTTRVATRRGQGKELQFEVESHDTLESKEDKAPSIQSSWSNSSAHVCDLCGKKFGSTVDLVLHANRYHKIITCFKCELCCKEYKSKCALSRHITVKHSRGN